MFVKDGVQVSPFDWIEYSVDGSGESTTMVQTQPVNATPAQLSLMGVTEVPVTPPPPPPPPAPITFIDYASFRARWTDAEKYALFKAQQADWRINDWINVAVAQNGVQVDSQDALAAKAAMVEANVLTQPRADAIFALA